MRRRARGQSDEREPWARWRLQATIGAVGVGALLAVFGIGYAVVVAVASVDAPRASVSATSPAQVAAGLPAGQARRDAIASAPMAKVPPQASRGGVPAPTAGPTMTVPDATAVGPARVPTGFSHTEAGAVGQLAAIESAVLDSMSISTAADIHQAWASPGAPSAATWELTGAVQAFLGSAAGQYVGDPTMVVQATPAAGQVKGVDGPDWVLACVLMDVKADIVRAARVAYGHCEAMAWSTSQQRWLIAAGRAPAPAPSTWPGTEQAIAAGWRTWNTKGE